VTKAEWLEPADVFEMPTFLEHIGRLRPFGYACCRRVWDLLAEECSRSVAEVAE
jgi:hypothetical protein